MERAVEKIKTAETDAAKLIAHAESEGRRAVAGKNDEIDAARRELVAKTERMLAEATEQGKADAAEKIAEIERDMANKTAQLEKSFATMKDELVTAIMRELR